jgi:hypothetical protein
LKGDQSNDDFFECYNYLQGRQQSKERKLNEIVDVCFLSL